VAPGSAVHSGGENRGTVTTDSVFAVLAEATELAQRYRALTGKPLGITGEVAEYEAALHLGLKLTGARQAGYDATETRDGKPWRLQIKGRCILPDSKPGQRIGSIDIGKEFDAVLLVRVWVARRRAPSKPRIEPVHSRNVNIGSLTSICGVANAGDRVVHHLSFACQVVILNPIDHRLARRVPFGWQFLKHILNLLVELFAREMEFHSIGTQ